MPNIFGREYKLIIDDGSKNGFIIEELRVSFKITKTLVGVPNLAEIQIYNLKEENRNKFKDLSNIELYAGYEGDIKLIFKGEIRNLINMYTKPDWITEIFAGDASKSLETSTINKTMGKGATTESIMGELLSNLQGVSKGVTEGLKDCITKKRSILKSIVLSGSVKEWIEKMAETCGFDYSINDGLLETVAKGKANTDVPTTLINQSNGLIGIPELTEIGADISVFMRPELKLGRRFKVTSVSATINVGNLLFRKVKKTLTDNTFRINTLVHTGDTHTNDWKTDITGQLVNA